MDQIWDLECGEGPLIALALHDSNTVRADVRPWLSVTDEERFREEDPHTAGWTQVAPTRVVALRSRFEVDLNRPEERAIYRSRAEAWGLDVWHPKTPAVVLEASLAQRRAFYSAMERLLTDFEERFGAFVLLDLHTYNHRRQGPDLPAADPRLNPRIDVGTHLGHRALWAPVIDRVKSDIRVFDFPGGRLDVGENVRFPLGPFAEWAHARFPGRVCALSIEVKKFFMDEWTGAADEASIAAIGEVLASVVPGVLEELGRLSESGLRLLELGADAR